MNIGRIAHRVALREKQRLGAPITFTLTAPGKYDEATDTWTEPTEQTWPGHAIRTRGKPETYESLSLRESEAPTLLFTPATYGDLPALGASVVWSGRTYTVADVDPVEPDGTAIMARVVVKR